MSKHNLNSHVDYSQKDDINSTKNSVNLGKNSIDLGKNSVNLGKNSISLNKNSVNLKKNIINSKKKDIKSKEIVLEIDNVSFSFAKNKVLSNVSLSIQKGDFIGLLGQNGSGKTTLLKLILGLYSLQKGSIRILGINISNFSDWSKIGYVPQKATDISDDFPASVKEIVVTGLLSSKNFPKKYSSQDYERVNNSLKKVGMKKYIDRRIGELSGGQQQRVLIARALITNPEILILDEPTTGVDQLTQNNFYDIIGKLNKEGITVILVSHDLERITNYVSKIASLNKTLEFYGSHEDFCMHPVGEKDHHCLMLKRG